MTVKRGACALAMAAIVAFGAASAHAGQIVYAHGGDLWVMNDDGSGQRPLATAAQIGGGVDNTSPSGQAISVQPGGNGVAFVSPTGPACQATPSNCPGLYSMINGKITRLTAPPAACGSVTVQCGSEEESPAVTSTGRVIYYRLDVASTFVCPYFCGFSGGFNEAFYSRALDGSDAAVGFPVPSPVSSGDPSGVDPDFEGPEASDPADPTKLAYQGDFLKTTYVPMGATGNAYPLDVDSTGGATPTATQPSYDDQFIYGLAFSADGSLLADIETGNTKGIWVYPTGQSFTAANPTFTWAMKDPDEGVGQSLDHIASGLTFVGNVELVFSANFNLYALPASCWATPSNASSPAPNCTIANAVALTTDGSQATPDTNPAWTSSTSPIPAFTVAPPPNNNGGGNSNNNNGGGNPTVKGDQVSKLALASKSIKRDKTLTVEVTLKLATKIKVEILRYVKASGHGRHRKKAHYTELGTHTFTGKVGLNKLKLTTIGGHHLSAGSYKAEVTAGGKTHSVTFTVHK